MKKFFSWERGHLARFLLALCLCVSVAVLLLADTTGDLRPTADGGSEQWTNEAGTACSSATCDTEVNEASGANCSTTPGDSTDNKSGTTSGQVQRYDIDESSIPGGATITSAVVRGCVIRGGSQNAGFTFRFCVNGTCTVSSTLTSTSAYADYSATLDFADDVKDGSDDYEIGVANTQARDVWLTAIKVDITFTPPAGGGPRRLYISRLSPAGSSR